MEEIKELRPQEGPQEDFLSSSADIVIFGGAAFGGKSFGLLLEASRHIDHSRYNGVIFRRESPQITSGGGLWDTASQMFPYLGGIPKEHKLTYIFPSNAYIKFTHLQHESDKLNHQGAQYVFIGFDELTHFTASQFWYLLTRNRPPSGCDIRPYCRCTTNPEVDSWVRDLIAWWIDEETGYAIKNRSGILRYFTRIDDEIIWVDKDWKDDDGNGPKSITFIPSYIDDNPIGMASDPTYKSNLLAQDKVTRERLMFGNWNINYKGGMFNPVWFKKIDSAPENIRWVRYWDRAATAPKDEDDDPDYTAGALVGMYNGELYIKDIKRFRETSGKNEEIIKKTALEDGHDIDIGYEVEPGSAGVDVADHYQRIVLKGYAVFLDRPTGNKIERCRPWCALAEQGHVYIVKGEWNREFLAEAGTFPFKKKDQIDGVSGGYKLLTRDRPVWPYYNQTKIRKFEIAWDKLEKESVQIYGVIYIAEDLSLYGNYFFWGRKSKTLRVYAEIMDHNPVVDRFAYNFIKLAQIPLFASNSTDISVSAIYANDKMFDLGRKDMKKLFKKVGVKIKQNLSYNEIGSILQASKMFRNNQIIVHNSLVETDRQYRTWIADSNKTNINSKDFKPVKGFPLCRALCIIVNILKEQGELSEPSLPRPYSRKKQNIRKILIDTMGKNPISLENKKNEYNYLIK